VIVETVGVGQAETDIASISDTVVLCVQPGSGDSLQYMKAGIAEIPDVAVVCKADLGRVVEQTKNDLEAALATTGNRIDEWPVPVVVVGALEGRGVEALIRALADHADFLAEQGRLERRRQEQAEGWISDALRDEFGRFGLELAAKMGAGLELAPGASPFGQIDRLLQSLRAQLSTNSRN
jgi:LAO/AO transport system kinase